MVPPARVVLASAAAANRNVPDFPRIRSRTRSDVSPTGGASRRLTRRGAARNQAEVIATPISTTTGRGRSRRRTATGPAAAAELPGRSGGSMLVTRPIACTWAAGGRVWHRGAGPVQQPPDDSGDGCASRGRIGSCSGPGGESSRAPGPAAPPAAPYRSGPVAPATRPASAPASRSSSRRASGPHGRGRVRGQHLVDDEPVAELRPDRLGTWIETEPPGGQGRDA